MVPLSNKTLSGTYTPTQGAADPQHQLLTIIVSRNFPLAVELVVLPGDQFDQIKY